MSALRKLAGRYAGARVKDGINRFNYYKSVWKALRSGSPRECNVCGYHGAFRAFGVSSIRTGVQCPKCGSLERQRLLKVWLDKNPDIFTGADLLHFAPERSVAGMFKPIVASYKSADIDGRSDLTVDIESMNVPDSSFDVVVCSHVLEHVDDRKALPEIRRILKKNGVAVLMVPMAEGLPTTFEDPNIQSRAERVLYYEDPFHVRYYGADFRERVAEAGFSVEEFTAEEPYVSRHRLHRGEKVFIARPVEAQT